MQLAYNLILYSPDCSHLLADISWAAVYAGQEDTEVFRTWALPLGAHILMERLRNDQTMPTGYNIQDKKTVFGGY